MSQIWLDDDDCAPSSCIRLRDATCLGSGGGSGIKSSLYNGETSGVHTWNPDLSITVSIAKGCSICLHVAAKLAC